MCFSLISDHGTCVFSPQNDSDIKNNDQQIIKSTNHCRTLKVLDALGGCPGDVSSLLLDVRAFLAHVKHNFFIDINSSQIFTQEFFDL